MEIIRLVGDFASVLLLLTCCCFCANVEPYPSYKVYTSNELEAHKLKKELCDMKLAYYRTLIFLEENGLKEKYIDTIRPKTDSLEVCATSIFESEINTKLVEYQTDYIPYYILKDDKLVGSQDDRDKIKVAHYRCLTFLEDNGLKDQYLNVLRGPEKGILRICACDISESKINDKLEEYKTDYTPYFLFKDDKKMKK